MLFVSWHAVKYNAFNDILRFGNILYRSSLVAGMLKNTITCDMFCMPEAIYVNVLRELGRCEIQWFQASFLFCNHVMQALSVSWNAVEHNASSDIFRFDIILIRSSQGARLLQNTITLRHVVHDGSDLLKCTS